MRAHQSRLALFAAATGVAGLLLTACGGGSADHAAGPTDPSSTPTVLSATSSAGSSAAADPSPSPSSADPSPEVSPVSDPSSAPATPGAVSACTLVTRANVAVILKGDPGPGASFTSHGASQCQYGEYQSAFVLVNLLPTRGNAAYDHAHDDPKITEAGDVADVAGVGDRAFSISGHQTASIYFTVGDALVLVMVEIRAASAPPIDEARALATVAAGLV